MIYLKFNVADDLFCIPGLNGRYHVYIIDTENSIFRHDFNTGSIEYYKSRARKVIEIPLPSGFVPKSEYNINEAISYIPVEFWL